MSGLSLGANDYKLVAAVGMTGATGAGHALVTFTDEKTVSSSNVPSASSTRASSRCPARRPVPLPRIDVGVTTASAGYQVSSPTSPIPARPPRSAAVDANGYANAPGRQLLWRRSVDRVPDRPGPDVAAVPVDRRPRGLAHGRSRRERLCRSASPASRPNMLICAATTRHSADSGLRLLACTTQLQAASEVTVYWEFDRNTFIDGVDGFVPYDTNVNWPPGTGNRSCPQSGVDFVSRRRHSAASRSRPTSRASTNRSRASTSTVSRAPTPTW